MVQHLRDGCECLVERHGLPLRDRMLALRLAVLVVRAHARLGAFEDKSEVAVAVRLARRRPISVPPAVSEGDDVSLVVRLATLPHAAMFRLPLPLHFGA